MCERTQPLRSVDNRTAVDVIRPTRKAAKRGGSRSQHINPVESNWPSTGGVFDGASMTTTPFDDPIAFNRRWTRVQPQARSMRAQAEPLLFIADHISICDRREGSVAVALTFDDGQSTMIVVPDGPPNPSDADCLVLLDTAIERSPSDVRSLGIVHHRRGTRAIADVDRRWALALTAVTRVFEIEPLGVMARLFTGDLVTVPLPDVLPSDYLDHME